MVFHLLTPPRSKLCLLCFRAKSLPVLAKCLLAVLLTNAYTGLQLDRAESGSSSLSFLSSGMRRSLQTC